MILNQNSNIQGSQLGLTSQLLPLKLSIILLFGLLVMSNLNFLASILNNKTVKNFLTYREAICNNIINTTDATKPQRFGQARILPLLVHVGSGNIDLVHHLQLGQTNIFTGTIENFKGIISLTNIGSPSEIKNLQLE